MKKHKAVIAITLLILLFALTIVLVIRHARLNNEPEVKVVVKNGLSINYIDGDQIYSDNKDNTYTFSITNDGSSERYYKIDITDLSKINNVIYSLYSDEAKINKEDEKLVDENILEYAVINPGETHTYKLKINSSLKKTKIGILTVDEYTFEQEYFAQTVILNSNLVQAPQTVVGTELATADEGLIQDIDDDGVTYYFRGNVQNNYVKFADMMWRIVRVNGNNTVKLILDGTTSDITEYYTNTTNNYFAYINTNIKEELSNWYSNNLSQYDKYIASSKVCDNTAYTGSEEYVFNASQRLTVNHNPTFNCLGTEINSKVSMLTADEVEYAGGLIGASNSSYFLYNGTITNSSWTLTPSKGNMYEYYPYTLSPNGSLEDGNVGSIKRSVRPVINIIKNVSVTGKGTQDDPYEILF